MSWQRLIFLLLTVSQVMGQAQKGRITREVDRNRTVRLNQRVHLNATSANEEGPVDPALEMGNLTLHFQPTAAQQAELDQLLADLHNPASANYQKWLSPEEFGARFGLGAEDRAKITDWLTSEGFQIDYTARGQHWLSFRGTAQQVERTFHTQLRQYRISGKLHYANAVAPSVPEAFAEVVGGIRGLHDFRLAPRHVVRAPVPEYTSASGQHYVAPEDFATIYNLTPLYQAGIDGSGINLVVLGQSDVNLADIRSFRSRFNLPANDPVKKVFGRNPGVLNGDVDEASLDLEWAGAVAPKANIIYVLNTDVFTSAQYAADQNMGSVMTISYGLCEQGNDPAFRGVAQQANAQGITWLAATGDYGSADCDNVRTSFTQATLGKSVDIPASFPEVTGVGGTQFNDAGGTFWSRGNTVNSGSALSYIPEVAWNESSLGRVLSTGGGASILFAKPLWQTGAGVPNDGARDLPDVALNASVQHAPYMVTSTGQTFGVGGTSAAAPSFAGIVALLNQYLISKKVISQPGLGNINPALYRLAQSAPSVFHDVTAGDNIVPCAQGSPDCVNGTFGFAAGPGYDQVTGLGSVDAYNLVTQWNSKNENTTLTVTASAASVLQNGSLQLKATVTAQNGTTPQGRVNFSAGDKPLGSAPLDGAGGSATASFPVSVTNLAVGTTVFTATYDGSSRLNGSAATVSVAIATAASGAILVPTPAPNPVYQSALDGTWLYSIRLHETAGVAATITSFTIDGADAMRLVQQPAIPALGSVTIAAVVSGLVPPVSRQFAFSGTDSSGHAWSIQLPIWFYGPELNPQIQMISALGTVRQNTAADASCQWSHPVAVVENGGFGVQLTRFTLGTTNLTSQIQQIFGTTRLAPYGVLQGNVCLAATDVTAGQSKSYALQGNSDDGSAISASLTASFAASAASAGALTVSQSTLQLRAPTQAGNATTTLGITLPDSSQAWTATILGSPRSTGWLSLSSVKGTGPGQIVVTATGAGLSDGVYNTTVVVQSPNATPPMISIPVKFTVGSATTTSIAGVAHGASFKTVFAPGMIMSVFGTQLAPSTQQAASLPLPLSLAGVSATVNGVAARFYFVSQGQLNIQVPYETSAGTAVLAVNNNGQIASFSFPVSAAAPGIFIASGNTLVPFSTTKAGQVLSLYMTGEGDVTPSLGDGEGPASTTALRNLPKPRLPVTVTVGGLPATTQFVGIPYGLAGVTQINFVVPATVAVGTQQVVVNVGGVDSPAVNITVTP